MTFIAENCFLWQKLAVELGVTDTVESVLGLLRADVKVLLVRFGLHSTPESRKLLVTIHVAIEQYAAELAPWKPVVGIACELSGTIPRVKFCRANGPIQLAIGRRIYLTSNQKYEDKKVENVVYVMCLEMYLRELKRGDLVRIGQVELKVCKIKGKFVECCVRNAFGEDLLTLVHPFERVQLGNPNGKWLPDNRITEECYLALQNGCRFILIPDLENHKILHEVERVLRNYKQENDATVQILATMAPHATETAYQQIVPHLSGLITDNANLMEFCRANCKTILYQAMDIEQFPDEAALRHIDTIITTPELVDELKIKLKEQNQALIQQLNPVITRKKTVLNKCIEYASKTCKANAIILCTTENVCAAERLSRKELPCPVLVTTNDDEAVQHLLLRKYCFPVLVPEGVTSTRLLIKYATVYGRKFGFLKVGNLTVTGFGDNGIQGLELRYVPDDFIMLFQ